MQVWDTAGQERFRTITQSYYRSAHGAIIAYDITRHSTFDSVTHWIKEVELYGASNVLLVLIGVCVCVCTILKYLQDNIFAKERSYLLSCCAEHFLHHIYIFCIPTGNKCDLEDKRQVQFEEACNLAKSRGILAALETSAKVKKI